VEVASEQTLKKEAFLLRKERKLDLKLAVREQEKKPHTEEGRERTAEGGHLLSL